MGLTYVNAESYNTGEWKKISVNTIDNTKAIISFYLME